jgi:pimeloyl-ACP methyl ester carboxylesterase
VQGALAVFLITLGIAQLASAQLGLWGASIGGRKRWAGQVIGLALIVAGATLLPHSIYTLGWIPLMVGLALATLLLAGSFLRPPPHPNLLFSAQHPAHSACQLVQIPDGDEAIPGYLLKPSKSKQGQAEGAAVCLIPGAGDTKTSFKWRLLLALLDKGLTVLTIDPPGHGDNRDRVLSYPDCLSVIPAAIEYLRDQPEIGRVGVVGISLGGAMAIAALAEQAKNCPNPVEALVVVATPVTVNYSRGLLYRETWQTVYRSPVVSLFRETTLKQIRESWHAGGYRSRHSTAELIELLEPERNIGELADLPILLVYSRRDVVAPTDHARAMHRAAPQAKLVEAKKASHVMLTLSPEINHQIAVWLGDQLRLP